MVMEVGQSGTRVHVLLAYTQEVEQNANIQWSSDHLNVVQQRLLIVYLVRLVRKAERFVTITTPPDQRAA